MVQSVSAHIMGSHIVYKSRPCIKYWSANGSLEPKHVANYILMTKYELCLTEYITLSYCITQRDGSYQNKEASKSSSR